MRGPRDHRLDFILKYVLKLWAKCGYLWNTLCSIDIEYPNMPFQKPQLLVKSHSLSLCTENRDLLFKENLKVKAVPARITK